MEDHRLTLQIFETLFEQLRYDDAKKFVKIVNKKTFIFNTLCMQIPPGQGKHYVVHADNEIEAKMKLIDALDEDAKIGFVYTYRYTYNRRLRRYNDDFMCKVCSIGVKTSDDKVAHYRTHDDQQVTEVLMKIQLFLNVDVSSIY